MTKQNMILMMQQIDDTCVQLTETIDKRDLHALAFVGDHSDVKMKDIAEAYLGRAVNNAVIT